MERAVRYSKKREAILSVLRETNCHPSVQSGIRKYLRQVQNSAAAVANEVTVGGDNGVKPLLTGNYAYALGLMFQLFTRKPKF